MSRDEIEAFTTLEGLGDPVRYLLDDVTAWARSFIRSNGNVRMCPDEATLPASCVSPAMDYVAVKILKRLSIEPSDIRKQARQDAIEYFNKVARREITPESFEADGAASTGGPAAETVSTMRRRTDGIEGF